MDYYLRPKLAYYAIKRELATLTIGTKRIVRSTPADRYTRVYVETVHLIELWASNFSLEPRTCAVLLKAWDISSGKETHSDTVKKGIVLKANQTTEIAEVKIPLPEKDKDEENRTVMAAYLIDGDGNQIARHVSWPEPLKYAPLQQPSKLVVDLSKDADSLQLSAEVPVKGVAVELPEGKGKVMDNGVDLVPGETVVIPISEASRLSKHDIEISYLGI